MRFLIFLLLPLYLKADLNLPLLREKMIEPIFYAAESGDPRCQCILGILYELGEELPQDLEIASKWYLLSAKQGYVQAQKRLGLLCFFGKGVSQDKVRGFSLILAASVTSPFYRYDLEKIRMLMKNSLSESEIAHAFELAAYWINENFIAKINYNQIALKKTDSKVDIISILDRWVPAESNERIYGPGTHDGNVGMLKSEHQKLREQHEDFISQLNELNEQIASLKHESLQDIIEVLKKEAENLRADAYKDLVIGILEAMAAGLSVEALPVALLSGWESMKNFKDAAENYSRSIEVYQEIERLMEMERSLEKGKEFERNIDRRG